jgi:2,3-bisphosphoglycerate-independent phosphoglycerate mutase
MDKLSYGQRSGHPVERKKEEEEEKEKNLILIQWSNQKLKFKTFSQFKYADINTHMELKQC